MRKVVIFILALTTLGFIGDTLIHDATTTEYRLVGYGCEGANGSPIYANEEDEFPRCAIIERMN